MYHFCTYFDHRYLLHGLTMYRSLERHVPEFTLHVLCLDDAAFKFLSNSGLKNIRPIALGDFEKGDDALLSAKQNRSLAEYYFTCTPSLPLYVMNHFPDVDKVAYLDADLFFFSGIEPIYEELGDNSILIIGHRFGEKWREHGEKHGIYNVGYLVFRNDERGRKCLQWWRERCIEWCYDILEEKRFGDQKYLDDWPERFEGVVVLQHKGANLARWNCMNYHLTLKDGNVRVDGQPLIFYHFNSFRIINRWLFAPDYSDYHIKKSMPPRVRRWLFGSYVREMKKSWQWVNEKAPEMEMDFTNARRAPAKWNVIDRLLKRELLISVGPFVY